MKGRFVPDDWELTERLRDYARKKGFTERHIEDQEEAFRLCQFPKQILCWDRAWQRWVRSAIEWGKVVPVATPKYRRPDELTEEQRQRDLLKHEEDVRRLRSVK